MTAGLDPVKLQHAADTNRVAMTVANVRAMAEMYQAGRCTRRVGEKFGMSACTVRRILLKAGVTMRPSGRLGVITPELVQEVCRLREAGHNWQTVADMIGVDRTTIHYAQKRGAL